MPSGAKKRKSAKKKKKNETNNSSASYSHGEDDRKIHDEKESDGEGCSPAAQDHLNHQHLFTEGEEEELEKRGDTATVRTIVAESEPMVGIKGNRESAQKDVMDENNAVEIDGELKSDGDSDSKNVSIKNGGRISLDGGSSSSSNSSSDDESRVVEKNVLVIESGESKVDDPNLIAGSAAFSDLVKPDGLPEVTRVTEDVLVMEAYNLVVKEPKEETCDPVATSPPSVTLLKPADLPEGTEVIDSVPHIEAHSLVMGTVPLADSENVSKEFISVNESLTVGNTMHSTVFELGLKENGKNESSGVSPVVMDMRSKTKEVEVASTEDANSAVSSGLVSFSAQEDEYKLAPSSDVPAQHTSSGGEHIKDYAISECSDSQPLVASARRPVDTTFWKSCCGLFEVFTGSNR